jgi:hypothetical protein
MSTLHRALLTSSLAFGLVLGVAQAVAGQAPAAPPAVRAIDRLEREAREAGLGPELLSGPLGSARRTLDRARGARAAGDEPHAALLDRLASEWLALGSATLRAVRAENAVRLDTGRAGELRTKLERGRALLAEQQARHGRLQAEVSRLEQERVAGSAGKPPTRPKAKGPGASAAPRGGALPPGTPKPPASRLPKKAGAGSKEQP